MIGVDTGSPTSRILVGFSADLGCCYRGAWANSVELTAILLVLAIEFLSEIGVGGVDLAHRYAARLDRLRVRYQSGVSWAIGCY